MQFVAKRMGPAKARSSFNSAEARIIRHAFYFALFVVCLNCVLSVGDGSFEQVRELLLKPVEVSSDDAEPNCEG